LSTKPVIKASQLKETIKKLHSVGLIDYKPGIELTRGQLTWVARQARENSQLLKHPENFKVAKVAKSTAKAMKASGIKVSKTLRAIVPLKGFDTAKIRGEKIVFEGANKKTGKRIKETVTLAQAGDFHAKLKHLSKTKLKRNQFLTVKIGDNASFNNRFQNYADMFHYVQNVFEPKDKGVKKEELMRWMSVVEIEERNPNASPKAKAQNKKRGK
jgi:Mn-dependent DtxR family transcriptional regulator